MSEHILILKNSVQADGGVSGQLVDHFTQGLLADNLSRTLHVRDLAAAQDEPEQALALQRSNEAIEEFQRADRIVIGLFVSGAIMVEFDKGDSLRAAFYAFHKSMGVTILALLVRWERHAAHAGHWVMYLLMAVTPVVGWAISDVYGYGVSVLGLPLPKVFPTHAEPGPLLSDAHTWLAYAFLGLVGVHLLAVAKHRYLDRDCVMHRMA